MNLTNLTLALAAVATIIGPAELVGRAADHAIRRRIGPPPHPADSNTTVAGIGVRLGILAGGLVLWLPLLQAG